MGLKVIVGTLELGCPVGWKLTLGLLVGVDCGLLLGVLLGCMEDVALDRRDGICVEGMIVGAWVGLAEGKFSGHDCVYDGEVTTLLSNDCNALEVHFVISTVGT